MACGGWHLAWHVVCGIGWCMWCVTFGVAYGVACGVWHLVWHVFCGILSGM